MDTHEDENRILDVFTSAADFVCRFVTLAEFSEGRIGELCAEMRYYVCLRLQVNRALNFLNVTNVVFMRFLFCFMLIVSLNLCICWLLISFLLKYN